MKKQYISPTIIILQNITATILAGSGPMVSGGVKDRDGNDVENGNFGYGGDGGDGDEGDAKFNDDDWGSIW